MTDAARLDTAHGDAVLARLGVDGPQPVTLDGLTTVYRAWCRAVPFDNVRKLIALRGGGSGPLPGIDPGDFFSAWLVHGTGGTCWPSSNGLFALVRHCGFEARRLAGSMSDGDVVNHGSVVVTIDGAEYLVDSSIQSEQPVPLSRHQATAAGPGWYPVTAEPDGRLWLVTFPRPDGQTMPCRFLHDDVDDAYCAARYEQSRTESIFNVDLYAHRADGDRKSIAIGTLLAGVDADGTWTMAESDAAGLRAWLRGGGYSAEIVEALGEAAPSLA